MEFSNGCTQCPRLAQFLEQVKISQPGYFAKPVPTFGDADARLLVVGLAPGMHGANRTGRPFTGDFAGELLYSTLYKFNFATSAVPLDDTGNANPELALKDCRITNAVRCLPPQNKPELSEVKNCNVFLKSELDKLPPEAAILVLGTIAHQAVLRALGLRQQDYHFAHGSCHILQGNLAMFDSYHCSRYNTQTKRLTTAMFHEVFCSIRVYLGTQHF